MRKNHAKTPSKSYEVGYRRPPNEVSVQERSKRQSDRKRKRPSKSPDLKAQLERELNKTVKIRNGKRAKTLTKAAAGIEQLVDQFAKGDRNARRDLISPL